jgi:hypothetical protein
VISPGEPYAGVVVEAGDGFVVEEDVSGPVAARTVPVSAGQATAMESKRRAAVKRHLDRSFLDADLNMVR